MSSLNIQIDQIGRQFLLDNKETIVLALPGNEDYKYLVACVSFSPFGDINIIDFLDDWIEYASSQSISYMDTIHMNTQQKVTIGNVYTFDNTGFKGSSPAYSDQVYGLLNERNIDGNYNLTCGLGQKVTINSSSDADYYAINVYAVPYNQTLYFETNNMVWIFAAGGISSNMIIPSTMPTPNITAQKSVVVGSYLEIDLKQTSTIYFDNLTHTFKVGSLPK
ncbi:hypothetical protein [Flavobacterium sp. ZS1P14]|uniref:hypothetical protein n=1 Tax=Flavobacterium sp. ZS1P14 TaxID=3401729 RepID=UPI003AAD58EF